MLKKTIKYVDYDGVEREEDFYFNLSKAELTELELSMDGGFSNYLQSIVASRSIPDIMAVAKDLVLRSYGIKSADGKYFEKSEELSRRFTYTPAYDELFSELFTGDGSKFVDFVNALIPNMPKEDKVQAPMAAPTPSQPAVAPFNGHPTAK